MSSRYATATSFRTALEQRLRQRAQQTGIALDRLRKEVAYQRFLARLDAVAPAGTWALKGGMALRHGTDSLLATHPDRDRSSRGALGAGLLALGNRMMIATAALQRLLGVGW